MRAEVPELRIIDQELWDKVKARQKAVRHVHSVEKKFWEHQRPRHLFSYLLKCGCCGSGMSKISKTHYGCSAVRNKGDSICDNRRCIRQDALEGTVLALLKERLMDPALLDAFCKEYTAHINFLRQEHNASVAGYRAELTKLQARQKRIIKAVMDGYDTPGMKDESNAIHAREQELGKLLAEQQEAPVLLHPNMAKRYRDEVRGLIAAMHDEKHGPQAIEIVRSLIEKVVLTPDPEGDGLLINLYGDLAGIVKIATGNSEFREEEEDALKQVRLVAGLPSFSKGSSLPSCAKPLLQGKMVAGEDLTQSLHRLQGKMVAGDRNRRDLHSIDRNQPSGMGKVGNPAFAVMQGKMVGPAGLEPATRPL